MSHTVDVNTATKTVTTTTTVPGVTGTQVETVVNGLRTQVVGVDGLTTKFGYDGLERPSTVTDSRNNTTTNTYVAGTALTLNTKDATNTTVAAYAYDGLGRQTSVTNAGGYVTYMAYNLRGQVTNQWGNASHAVAYGYNGMYGERISQSTFRTPVGSTIFTTSTWPATPPPADTTQWTFDGPSGLLTSKMDPSGAAVSYTYNSAGQTATRKWARNVTTTYTYDTNTGLGNGTGTGALTGVTYSDSTPAVSYAYTRTGQMQLVTDVTGTRTFNYTNASQPTELDSVSLSGFYNSRILAAVFNSDGLLPGRVSGFQLGTAISPAADLSQTYSFNGQSYFSNLVSTSQAGTNSVTFNYGYLASAPLVQSIGITGNSNYSVTRGYETQRNLLTSIQNNWGTGAAGVVTQFNYIYNSLGQRYYSVQSGSAFNDFYSGTAYSSLFNYHTYDSYGQLTNRTMYRNSPPATLTSPATPVAGDKLPGRSFQFDYDNIGNRIDSGEPGALDTYEVNSLNQYSARTNNSVRIVGNANASASLTASSGTVSQLDRNYALDVIPENNANGPAQGSVSITATVPGSAPSTVNRSYFVPAANQTFQYDADGNLTADGVWNYGYDAENRLISMVSQLSGGFTNSNLMLSYTYDFQNRRVEKKVYNLLTLQTTFDRRYLYSGNNLIAEMDQLASGNIVRSYTWGLDLTGSLDATDGVGALLQITNNTYSGTTLTGTTNYLTQFDGNGNVSALVRASDGLLAAVYEYGAFGETLRHEIFDPGIKDNAFKFSTKFTDSETGLVNYGNRYYSPTLGRFINRDPIEEAGGTNLYGFCGNDGVDRFDVLGCSWLSKLWDRTILSLGKHIAQNWDHGKMYVEMAVAVILSCVIGPEVAAWVGAEFADAAAAEAAAAFGGIGTSMGDMVASMALATYVPSTLAVITAGVAGGAAAGFVSGFALAAMSGKNLGQDLTAGLKGAEFGAIDGAITAGTGLLDKHLGPLQAKFPNSPHQAFLDIGYAGVKAMEGYVKNGLENKNGSSGFWSGLFSGLSDAFKPTPSADWERRTVDYLAKGVIGGVGSMDKHGKGFQNGFWSAESSAITSDTKISPWLDTSKGRSAQWYENLISITEKGIAAGVVTHIGHKSFDDSVRSSLRTGYAAELLKDGIAYGISEMESTVKPTSPNGGVNAAYKLLQPKVGKKGVTYPINSISGGSWALGAPWAQL